MPNSSKRQPLLTLVYPRFRYPSGDYPIGVALLAAVVRKQLGWRVQLSIHLQLTWTGLANWILQSRCRWGWDEYAHAWWRVGNLRDRTSVGCEGRCRPAYPSMFPTDPTIQIMDAVTREGEGPLVNLLTMWQTGHSHPIMGAHIRNRILMKSTSNERDPVQDLDSLPFPAWDLIDMHAYFDAWGQLDSVQPGLRGVNLSGSRGCPFTCTFCAETLHEMFGRKLRQRSPESIVAELVALKSRYNIEAFCSRMILTTNRKYVERFCMYWRKGTQSSLWRQSEPTSYLSILFSVCKRWPRKVGIGLESATERIVKASMKILSR